MLENVTIIGRTNAGKSTLFNRIYGKKQALVHARPGTTRDRNEAVVNWKGIEFNLIDTGGWAADDSIFSASVKKQLEFALKKSNLVILLVDGHNGFHPLDAELNNILRKQNKNVLLVVNKIDSSKDEMKLSDFYRLGIENPIPVSANHGLNIPELMDRIIANLSPVPAVKEIQKIPIKIILVGKPNVGKSSLVNALSKEERSIVHDTPGTTREALDISFNYQGQDFVIIDTPGLHRKHKFKDDMEYLSSLSTHHAVERADVAVLVMDASQEIGETEARIAELVIENHKACLIAINKWDLVQNKEAAVKFIKQTMHNKLRFLSWCKIILISAKTGQRTERIFSEVREIYKEYTRFVPEQDLKDTIRRAEERKPMSRKGKVLRIKEVKQTAIMPPTFNFLVNDTELVHFSYRRYIDNCLRAKFGFVGTPIVLRFYRNYRLEKNK